MPACAVISARALFGFDHQHAQRQPGQNAIAHGKVRGTCRGCGRERADHGTVRDDACGQFAVPRRVHHVATGADHGDSAAGAVQRAGVRGAVDAGGQPAADSQACRAQLRGEATRVGEALGRGRARADDGKLRQQQPCGIAAHEQGRGCARTGVELRREIGIEASEQPLFRLPQPVQIGVNARGIRRMQPGAGDGGKALGRRPAQPGQQRRAAAVARQQGT